MKIQGQNKQMLAAACQMFMGKSEGEIAHIALETLEGHQRAIIAHLTVEVGFFLSVLQDGEMSMPMLCLCQVAFLPVQITFTSPPLAGDLQGQKEVL